MRSQSGSQPRLRPGFAVRFAKTQGFVITRRHWLAMAPAWAGILAVAACSPQSPPATEPAPPAPAAGLRTARVWFLRGPDASAHDPDGGPMLFANSRPLGRSPPATAFFHDFRPGRYHFSVGSPDGSETATFQLAPGMESYLLVRSAPARAEAAAAVSGAFTLSALPPQTAKQTLPALADLGRR